MKVNIGKYRKLGTPRTIKVHIDDWDTWSLDHTLAQIIHPALVKFKEDSKMTGHPCLCEDPSACTIDDTGGCPCSRTWQDILDKMIWSFGEIVSDDIGAYEIGEYAEYQRRVQEGLQLFGQYYQSLWT